MKFVTKQIHAYLDYPVALGLMVMPFIFGLGQTSELAFWLSVATGVAALILTILTDHHLGLIRVLPYSFHLLVDGLVGVTFVLAPFALGFSGIDFAYYLVLGLTVLLVVGLHKPDATSMAT